MKKILFTLLLVCASALVQAQSLTTVSGTVTDADGNNWINATCTVTFVPSPTQPNPAQYFNQGVQVTTPSCNYIPATASFSFSAGQNSVIAPSGSAWQLTLCPQASTPCQNYTFTANGASLSLTAALTASLIAPRFFCGNSCYGYSTAEIQANSVVPGAQFFNTTSGTCNQWSGTAWSTCGGGGLVTNMPDFIVGGTSTQNIVGANITRIYSFDTVLPVPAFSKITYGVTTADNTANLYSIGIYNTSGTLICGTAATAGTTFAPTTGARTLSFQSPCPALTAGTRYYVAYTGNAAVAGLSCSASTMLAVGNIQPSSNSATTGGALNSSIGIPADTWVSTVGMVGFSLHN